MPCIGSEIKLSVHKRSFNLYYSGLLESGAKPGNYNTNLKTTTDLALYHMTIFRNDDVGIS